MPMFLQTLCLSLAAGVNGNRCSESFTLLEKYRIGKVIGDGNFAVVKECMDRWVALDLFPYRYSSPSGMGRTSSPFPKRICPWDQLFRHGHEPFVRKQLCA